MSESKRKVVGKDHENNIVI